jgi:acylphosphatase
VSDRTRAHVLISGTVQEVFFRATTKQEADERDVAGWVQNNADGRVEAVFEGPEAAVEAMVAFGHEGSPAAPVETVEVSDEPPRGLSGFEIRR